MSTREERVEPPVGGMIPPQPEEQAYTALVLTLTWGFRAALAALLVGLGVALIQRDPLERRVEPIGDIASGVVRLQAAALVDLGIVLLLMTPVAAVVILLIGFAQRRDWVFVLVTLVVLGALGSGIVLAFR